MVSSKGGEKGVRNHLPGTGPLGASHKWFLTPFSRAEGARAAVFLPKGKQRRVNGKPLDEIAKVEPNNEAPETEVVAHVTGGQYSFRL